MLCIIRDSQDHILAACEWTLVNDQGYLDVNGSWVWIWQLEVSAGSYGVWCMKEIIRRIAKIVPAHAKGAYWWRLDKTGKKQHGVYTRQQLLQFAREVKEDVGVR